MRAKSFQLTNSFEQIAMLRLEAEKAISKT